MKHPLFTLLFLCFSCFQARAQSPFYLHLNIAADSATSIFSQNKWEMVPAQIDYYNEEADSLIYAVIAKVDSTKLELKFPSDTNWISEKEAGHQQGAPYTMVIWERSIARHFLNLMPIFAEKPEVWAANQGGGPLQVRYGMYVSQNNGPYEYIYTNIDTIFLPPATGTDIDAFNFLMAHEIDIDRFSNLSGRRSDKNLHIEIFNNYQNTLIGEIAKYLLAADGYDDFRYEHPEATYKEQYEWFKSKYAPFKDSPSEMIIDKVTREYLKNRH